MPCSSPSTTRCSSTPGATTNCCLPAGATEATLAGSYPNLQPGDVLIFEEVLGPQTGEPADADIRHRCAVRLTQVSIAERAGPAARRSSLHDGSATRSSPRRSRPRLSPKSSGPPTTRLPFPVCISSSFVDSTRQAPIPRQRQRRPRQRRPRRPGSHRSTPSRSTPFQSLPSFRRTQRPLQPAATRRSAGPLSPRPARQPHHAGRPAAARSRSGHPGHRAARHVWLCQPHRRATATRRLAFRRPIRGPGRNISASSSCQRRARPAISISRSSTTPRAARTESPLPVTLENFPDLSLSSTDPNYAVTQINALFPFPPGTRKLHAERYHAHGVPGQSDQACPTPGRSISSTPAAPHI